MMEKFKVTMGGQLYAVDEVRVERYMRGGLAVSFYENDPNWGPELLSRITIWSEEKPAEGCFWLKDYAENIGLFESLQTLGFIETTGRTTRMSWVTVAEVRFTGALGEEIAHQTKLYFGEGS